MIASQTWLMVAEVVGVSVLFLACFRARRILGLVPVYTVLGVIFYACNLYAASIYVNVAPNIVVSPGTVAFFPVLLAVLLLVYITEDTVEARKLIYGFLIGNVFTVGLAGLTALHLVLPGTINAYHLAPELFALDPRVSTVSVGALFIDSFVLILLYEIASRYTPFIFLRFWFAMAVTLIFDTLIFITGAYANNPHYVAFLYSAIAGKTVAGLLYSAIFTVFLEYFDIRQPINAYGEGRAIGPTFRTLTYRQKFELLQDHVQSLTQNITEYQETEEHLRASESQLRRMLEDSPIAITVGTRDGRSLFYNSKYAEMFGIPDDGEEGQAFDEVRASYANIADRGRLVALTYGPSGRADEIEVERVRADGSRCWTVVWWRRITFEGQDAHLSWLYDATERRRAAEELRLAKEAAEAAAAAKSDFLATMSHEIRTPLNGILSNIELLTYTSMTAEQGDLVHSADVAAGALITIIGEILDFSKIEAGKIELERTEMDPSALVGEVASLMAPLAKQKTLLFESHVGPDVPGVVVGDALRIRQVLMNLVSNAIKFTETGFVRVELTRAAREGELVHLRFTVADSGIGFDPERAEALFSPFVQAEDSTARRFGGTGLGLPISRELVRLMGGSIECESVPGRGATFWFTIPLPIVREEAVPDATPDVESLLDGELRGLTGGRRILVAEDNPMNQLVVRRQLDKLGLAAEIADDGAAALAAFEREEFALILADVAMPVMDGYELTRRIRAREAERSGDSHIPIIALTANALSGEAARAAAAGMDAYLTKPVGLQRLAATMRRWLVGVSALDLAAAEDLPERESGATGEAPLDLTALKLNLGLADGELGAVLGYFVETQQPLLATINAHVAARQAVSLQNAAHAAKGAARNACAARLAAQLAALEAAAGEADWSKIETILPALDEAFAEVKRAIEEVPVP